MNFSNQSLMMDPSSAAVAAAAAAAAATQSFGYSLNSCMSGPDANNNFNGVVNANLIGNSVNGSSYMNGSMMSATNSNDSICDENDPNYDFSSKTNLIVNYLPQNMTQDEIKAVFSNIGPVDSCKLIKDKLTGQSLGYAFVNFVKQEDAEKAISSLNGMRLQNKTIKVSYARPSSDSIKGANLYVCGLDKDFSQADLEKMFNPFGTIISSKILTDPKTGVSKGVGFVRFDQRNEAEIAINKLHGQTYEHLTEPLVVKFANSPTSAKLVMGLPLAPYMPACRSFFQPYRSSTNASYRYSPMSGYCPDASIIHQHSTGSLSGMLTPTTNSSLANSLNCTPNPSNIPVTPSLAPLVATTAGIANTPASNLSSPYLGGWCIFVYNLGPDTDENILWQLFGPFGAVQSVNTMKDAQTQKCRGYGFVTMTNYDDAAMAINCLNGINLQNRTLQVSFKTSNKPQFV